MIETRKIEEKNIVFNELSNQIAMKLGVFFSNKIITENIPVAFSIYIANREVFKATNSSATGMNDLWIKRKINTVMRFEKSTLHVRNIMEQKGKDMSKDWHLELCDYTNFGGGFPIITKGGAVVGAIAVSGLDHLLDHDLLITVLKDFLEIGEFYV